MKVLQEIFIPAESVKENKLTVINLLFKNGDFVEKNNIVIELESSKTIFTAESEVDGYIEYYCDKGDNTTVNIPIIRIYDNNESIPKEINKTAVIEKSIFKSDKETYSTISDDEIDKSKVTIKNISPTKKREIEYLSHVQSAGLTGSVSIYIETDNIFEFINPHVKFFKNSILPVIIFEASKLLKLYPNLNAYFHNNEIHNYNDVNIGFAVDIDDGLKIIKLGDADKKSLKEIDKELFTLSNKYLDKKLEMDDLTDITFSISDLSSQNINFLSPLVNKKNSAMLGISSVDKKVNRIVLTLMVDHRVTEGKEASLFLSNLKDRVESYKFSDENGIDSYQKRKLKRNLDKVECFKCLLKINDDEFNDYFLKVIDKDGNEKFICKTCLKGW